MKYRTVVLEDNLDITTAATRVWDVNLADVVSRFIFKWNVQNDAATPVIIAHPARSVTKIELIDGSHILASLSGEEMLVQNYYDHKIMPHSYINGVTNTQSIFTETLDFGRYLWDQQLAFDPRRYNNPQLRLTYNKALYETAADAMYVTIMADVFDEKAPSPSGFLKRHEVTTWTPANSAAERLLLPVDFPIRALFAAGYSTTAEVGTQIHDFKISEDTDKKVPINIPMSRYLGLLSGDYPPIEEPITYIAAAATEVIYTMASRECIFVPVGTLAPDNWLTSYTADTLTMDSTATGNRAEGMSHGYIPFHTVPFYFGDRDDPADWYDPVSANVKKLEAICTGGAAVGTSPVGRLHVEQLVPF